MNENGSKFDKEMVDSRVTKGIAMRLMSVKFARERFLDAYDKKKAQNLSPSDREKLTAFYKQANEYFYNHSENGRLDKLTEQVQSLKALAETDSQ